MDAILKKMAAITVKMVDTYSTDIYDTIVFLQVYAPQNLDIESRLKAQYLLISEIDVLLRKWTPSFLNRLQNGGYTGMVY